jgi:hypothetical protein
MSQDGLLREMLLLKYRLEIFQILLVSNSIGVFWGEGGGRKLFRLPFIKHLVGARASASYAPAVTNLFSRAFQLLKSIRFGICNLLENFSKVFSKNLIKYLQHNV